MYIEDLLNKLDTTVRFRFWNLITTRDGDPINSLARNVRTGAGFTVKQRGLAIQLLKKHHQQLTEVLGQDVMPFINSPQFRLATRTPINTRTVKVEQRHDKHCIAVRFPYDSALIALIHCHRQKHYPAMGSEHIQFEHETKAWLFDINEVNLAFMGPLSAAGFLIDPLLLPAIEQINQIIENSNQHIPHLAVSKESYCLVNVADTVPSIASPDLLTALIHARRYGINDWDDAVQQHIDTNLTLKQIEKFFRCTTPGGLIERQTIECWVPMFSHCDKMLFVVPGGIELDHTKKIYNLLMANGYQSDEISIMFRTCNKKNPEFNRYVNENQLNNPLGPRTRAVMISGALPKPLVSRNFNFDLVICGGTRYSNARLRNYLNQLPNVVWIED